MTRGSGLRSNQDVLAGVLFLLIGLGAVAGARDYEMGTAMRMGPAYFPTVLGWILYALRRVPPAARDRPRRGVRR